MVSYFVLNCQTWVWRWRSICLHYTCDGRVCMRTNFTIPICWKIQADLKFFFIFFISTLAIFSSFQLLCNYDVIRSIVVFYDIQLCFGIFNINKRHVQMRKKVCPSRFSVYHQSYPHTITKSNTFEKKI